jgi:hypothetical protein
MSKLAFTVIDARIEPYAVVPTLIFGCRLPREPVNRFMPLRSAVKFKWSQDDGIIRLVRKASSWNSSVNPIVGAIL